MTTATPAVIDAHAHCGQLDLSMALSIEDYTRQVVGSQI